MGQVSPEARCSLGKRHGSLGGCGVGWGRVGDGEGGWGRVGGPALPCPATSSLQGCCFLERPDPIVKGK